MRLTKNVGKATYIQFGFVSLMSIPAGLKSIISTCVSEKGDCVSNSIVSVVLYIMIVGWFGAVAALGYATQEKRKKWMAITLIMAQLAIAFVAYINFRGHSDLLSVITSIVDIILALWIIFLSVRLTLSGGGRIVTKPRSRQRKTTI